MTKLPERLQLLRKGHHITQTEAAKGMGLVYITYRRYETGEREPDASTLVRMADFYHVSIDYLVGRIDWSR